MAHEGDRPTDVVEPTCSDTFAVNKLGQATGLAPPRPNSPDQNGVTDLQSRALFRRLAFMQHEPRGRIAHAANRPDAEDKCRGKGHREMDVHRNTGLMRRQARCCCCAIFTMQLRELTWRSKTRLFGL